jgi:hypothetical protein
MGYPKGTISIGDLRAGFVESIWSTEDKAEKERLRLISEDKDREFPIYEVEEWEVG